MERQISTRPLALPRSRRRDEWRGLTSARAGSIVPIAYFPLLREDRLRGEFMAQVRMEEALHTIVNPVRVRMSAHLVSKIALERFEGSVETLNRSYMGKTLPGGAAAPAWHVRDPIIAGQGDDDKGHVIFDKLGVHYKATTPINSDLLESYWTVVNWRRASVSKALTKIPVNTNALAPAFWDSWKFDMVKPSFDAAMMEGAIELSLQGTMPVRGLGYDQTAAAVPIRDTTAGLSHTPADYRGAYVKTSTSGAGDPLPLVDVDLAQSSGIMTLANLELAKKTQAFAKMRERYQGIPDEYLIDLLMQGINVPPEDFREPILIARAETVIGQTERYATDGASLDQSVTNGMAQLRFGLNTPNVGPGGMVLITMEIVPEQLYERTLDAGLRMDTYGSAEWLPDALRDYLDPQKVEAVPNAYADVFHSDPTGVFGYAPLNYQWQRHMARVGGRYKRPLPDAFVEDRQRIWAVEKADPSLSADFYVCPDPFPHTVFADADADPFEIITIGNCVISGLTVFGQGFEEDDGHYEKIMAEVDQTRISSDPPASHIAAPDTAVPPLGGDLPDTPETAAEGRA